ncbi:MAG: winged helix-turn-helix domain-containing protein [Novosphingobium sp.]
MARVWAIDAYKSRLDSAIERENWEETDRIRVAAKRRLIEMIASGASHEQVTEARDALTDSFNRLRLSKRIRIEPGPVAIATRFSADIETAGIAAEQAPLQQDTARNAKERILEALSSGNRRPRSTSELAEETGYRVETVARAIGQLRAEGRILSRRAGRNVMHRVADRQRHSLRAILYSNTNQQVASKPHPAIVNLFGTTTVEPDDGVAASQVAPSRGIVMMTQSKPTMKFDPQGIDVDALSSDDDHVGGLGAAQTMLAIGTKSPVILDI